MNKILISRSAVLQQELSDELKKKKSERNNETIKSLYTSIKNNKKWAKELA